ncbi:MAG: 5-formyltetrahydrofolate cyclo-ligase [Gammaproteobacteria bacterium]|nr:MAG: 5-formyltetrahydrofolate cyclo-ligase [Gammaproteobacteria bacterium]
MVPTLNLGSRRKGTRHLWGRHLCLYNLNNNYVATHTSKQQLRQELRQYRLSLSTTQQAQAAIRLAHNLKHLRQFRSSQRIACYLASDGEIETATIIDDIWAMGKQCYLPVLNQSRIHPLRFAHFNEDSALVTNRFDIPEPVIHPRNLVHAVNLDLILLPLVGFDTRGNRLGMGGGFYDRCLQFMNRRQFWQNPTLVGLAYHQQLSDKIRPDAWDVKLHAIVTDQEIILAK